MNHTDWYRPNLRSDSLLPLVRAAMSRGEGPPAVLAWVRSQGHGAPKLNAWSNVDEARARTLAGRLAAALSVNHGGADSRTKQLGDTFAARS
jgi:hypothetical protein